MALTPIQKVDWSIVRVAVDLAPYLARIGGDVTLDSLTVVAPDGITAASAGVDGSIAYPKLSGGTADESYDVVLRPSLSNGDTFDLTLTVNVVADILTNRRDEQRNAVPVYLDPDADLLYGVDWTDRLAEFDDVTISTSTWPDVTGLTIDSAQVADGIATARFSGITAGTEITARNRVTFDNGDRDQRSILLKGANL